MTATRKSKKRVPAVRPGPGLRWKPTAKELKRLKPREVKPPKPPKADHPNHQLISDILAEGEEHTLTADGLGEALVGLSLSSPGRPALAIYDYEKCVRVLVRRDKMTDEEAREFLDFNTVGAWCGDHGVHQQPRPPLQEPGMKTKPKAKNDAIVVALSRMTMVKVRTLRLRKGDILVFTLGNLEHGVLPTEKDLQNLRGLVQQALPDPHASLFLPPVVEVTVVRPKKKV